MTRRERARAARSLRQTMDATARMRAAEARVFVAQMELASTRRDLFQLEDRVENAVVIEFSAARDHMRGDVVVTAAAEGMQYGRRIARDDWAGRLDNGPEAAAAVVREMCARIAREHHRLGLGLAQRKLLPLLGDLERWDMQRGPR